MCTWVLDAKTVTICHFLALTFKCETQIYNPIYRRTRKNINIKKGIRTAHKFPSGGLRRERIHITSRLTFCPEYQIYFTSITTIQHTLWLIVTRQSFPLHLMSCHGCFFRLQNICTVTRYTGLAMGSDSYSSRLVPPRWLIRGFVHFWGPECWHFHCPPVSLPPC